MRVHIIGAGRTGRALGRVLALRGGDLGAVYSRSRERAGEAARFIGAGRPTCDLADAARGADVLLLTVVDDAIPAVAEAITGAPDLRAGALAVHCAGVYDHALLSPLRARGLRLAAIHPLRSFADPGMAAERFAGTFCFFDAEPEARGAARRLIEALGGVPVEVPPEGKALYHAAGVFGSNYVVALADAAREAMASAGAPDGAAWEAVLSLLEGTVANLRALGVDRALTGPIERGDVVTVQRHLEALSARPGLADLYRRLGTRTHRIALRKGAGSAALGEVLE